ncbi:hypothetical protein CWN01_31785, partial [Klebsiella pneumoniae]
MAMHKKKHYFSIFPLVIFCHREILTKDTPGPRISASRPPVERRDEPLSAPFQSVDHQRYDVKKPHYYAPYGHQYGL